MNTQAYPDIPKTSYVAMSNYYKDIFAYGVTTDKFSGETTGILSSISLSLSNSCAQGHFLVETGKRVYPGGAYPGISTMMVSVFDPCNGVKGYIDPNSYAFTDFSSERPGASVDANPKRVGVNPNSGSIQNDLAPPVYTQGDVLAAGNFDLSGSEHIYGSSAIRGNVDISGNEKVYGNLYVGGELVNTTSIGAANIVWRNFQSPAISPNDGALFGSAVWDGTNYQLAVNPSTGTSGYATWTRNYPLGVGQDLHVSFTSKNYTNYSGGGVRGDLMNFYLGATVNQPPATPDATTGITVQINDIDQKIYIYNKGTLKVTLPLGTVITTDDNIWHTYDIIYENVGGSVNVTIYIDGVFSGIGTVNSVTSLGSYIGFFSFAGSDDTSHFLRSLTVKPARSWQLTH